VACLPLTGRVGLSKGGNVKIPPKRVPADDCAVYVGRRMEGGLIVAEGEAYYVHEGEWVDVVPVTTIQDSILLDRLLKAARQGDEAEAENNLMALCAAVADKVIDWNWTDLNGKKFPKPHGKPDVIKLLTPDELSWLQLVLAGESPGQRKNASSASPAS